MKQRIKYRRHWKAGNGKLIHREYSGEIVETLADGRFRVERSTGRIDKVDVKDIYEWG